MKSTKKSSLKWAPAMPIVKQDNLVSSRAREAGEIGFKPTYEKDEENMYFILSNEYLRMWQNERSDYEREVYSKQDTESDSKTIKRRFVQHFVKYPDKGIYLPPLTLKMFKRKKKIMEVGLEKAENGETKLEMN